MPSKTKEPDEDYTKGIKKLLAAFESKFRLSKNGLNKLGSIIESLNTRLVESVRAESGKSKEISFSSVVSTIKKFPKGLKNCAMSEGNRALLKLDQGDLIYKPEVVARPKTISQVKPDVFKKGLIEITKDIHKEHELSPKATKLGCKLIYNLARTFISRAVCDSKDGVELTVNNLIVSIGFTMGPDLLELAVAHGYKLLDRYSKEMLDFKIETDSQSQPRAQLKVFGDASQKLSEQQHGLSLTNDAHAIMNSLLFKLISRLIDKTVQTADEGSLKEIQPNEVYTALKESFPDELFENADNNARINVFNYACGQLKYTPPPKTDGGTLGEGFESGETLAAPLNLRKCISVHAPHLVFARSSVSHLSNLLSDVCDRILTETMNLCTSRNTRQVKRFHILEAAIGVLSGELVRHAFANIQSIEENVMVLEEEELQLPIGFLRNQGSLSIPIQSRNEDLGNELSQDEDQNAGFSTDEESDQAALETENEQENALDSYIENISNDEESS